MTGAHFGKVQSHEVSPIQIILHCFSWNRVNVVIREHDRKSKDATEDSFIQTMPGQPTERQMYMLRDMTIPRGQHVF
jgi:hypothetical protein